METVYIYFFTLDYWYWTTALIISLFHVFVLHGLQILKACSKMFQISYSTDDIFRLWSVLCIYNTVLAATSASTHLGQDKSVFGKGLHLSVWMHSWLLTTGTGTDTVVQCYQVWIPEPGSRISPLMVRSLLLPPMGLGMVTITSHCCHAADVCRPCWTVQSWNTTQELSNNMPWAPHCQCSAVSMFAFHHLRPVLSLWIYTWYRKTGSISKHYMLIAERPENLYLPWSPKEFKRKNTLKELKYICFTFGEGDDAWHKSRFWYFERSSHQLFY